LKQITSFCAWAVIVRASYCAVQLNRAFLPRRICYVTHQCSVVSGAIWFAGIALSKVPITRPYPAGAGNNRSSASKLRNDMGVLERRPLLFSARMSGSIRKIYSIPASALNSFSSNTRVAAILTQSFPNLKNIKELKT
jgi:hypothetical protein